MSIPGIHDVTVTVTGNCDHCCENDICCCFGKTKEPKKETVQHIALMALAQNEQGLQVPVPILLTQRIVIEKHVRCCVVM